MPETQDLPGLYRGGRPTTTSQPSPPRAAALPGYFVWIPALLIFVLVIGLLHFWNSLQPSWVDLLQTEVRIDLQYFSGNGHADEDVSTGGTQRNSLSATFTPEVKHWGAEILDWAQDFNLDPNLIALVMQIESCGHPTIRSNAGALGLFQVMPFHFTRDEDPLEPQTNAKRGLSYLARSLELSGNRVDLTLAGYNGGHGLIHRLPSTWPTETKRYVKWGIGILEEIRRGEKSSSTLEAWLTAGGERLCQEAYTAQRK